MVKARKDANKAPKRNSPFLTMFLRCDAIVKLPLKSKKDEALVTFFRGK
jgi:hypothetical protein